MLMRDDERAVVRLGQAMVAWAESVVAMIHAHAQEMVVQTRTVSS
jgi:hypothetical protein